MKRIVIFIVTIVTILGLWFAALMWQFNTTVYAAESPVAETVATTVSEDNTIAHRDTGNVSPKTGESPKDKDKDDDSDYTSLVIIFVVMFSAFLSSSIGMNFSN